MSEVFVGCHDGKGTDDFCKGMREGARRELESIIDFVEFEEPAVAKKSFGERLHDYLMKRQTELGKNE